MLWRKDGLLAIVVIAAAARVTSGGESRLAAAPLLQRLQTEAVADWRAMAEKLRHSEFDYTIVESEKDRGLSRERTKRIRGRLDGERFLFTEALVFTDHVSVYGRNGRYEFSLVRRGESPWTVAWQSSRRDEETPVGSAHAYLGGMLRLPWSISATPLERLVRHPRFSIREARRQGGGDVQIVFTVSRGDARDDELQGLSSGIVVLDPDRNWAVTNYRAQYAPTMSSTVKLEYGHAGPPELRRVHFVLQSAPGRSSGFAIEVDKYDWAAASNAEYTLSAFGLPEYQDPADRRRWLRLVNLGIILILLGLILWRRSHGIGIRKQSA